MYYTSKSSVWRNSSNENGSKEELSAQLVANMQVFLVVLCFFAFHALFSKIFILKLTGIILISYLYPVPFL